MELIDPIQYGQQLEKVLINERNQRPYRSFKIEPFYGQIATARSVGCNVRCAFCWTDPNRDDPENQFKDTVLYTPEGMVKKLIDVSSNEYGRAIMTTFFRISGCEPTIGMNHLLEVLKNFEKETGNKHPFLLETNGMILGHDEKVAEEISRFRNMIQVRLSLKAGTREGLEKRTHIQGKFVDLPFRAINNLEKYEIPYSLATIKDAKLMPPTERKILFRKIFESSSQPPLEVLSKIEEENIDLFGITRKRLMEAGLLDQEMTDGIRHLYEPMADSLSRVYQQGRKLKTITKKKILELLDITELRIDRIDLAKACAACPKKCDKGKVEDDNGLI